MTAANTTTPPESNGNGKNTAGLIGFIFSIVGILSCGLLSIIGLLVSIIGLFKKPRGLAIAGTILSLVGLIFLAVVGAGIIAGIMGIQKAGGIMQQGVAMGLAQQEIQVYYNQNGKLPDAAEVDTMVQNAAAQLPGFMGGQGNLQVTYTYTVIDDDTYQLTFPGLDEQMGTADDLDETIDVFNSGFGVQPTTPTPAPSDEQATPVTPPPAP